MAIRPVLLSKEAIRAVAGNEGTFKRGIEVQISNKISDIDFSGEQLEHGFAKCEGSSPGDKYSVKFELDLSTSSAKPRADCTCPSAQRGLCKHVVALLLVRMEKIQAQERLKARQRVIAARSESSGKNVLPEDRPPPPPLAAPPTTTTDDAGPSDVAAVFHPMVTNALAAGSALSADGGGASTSNNGRRVLPSWMQPKAKPEPKASREKKGRVSAGGANADIRTMLGPKKRPLEVSAKHPSKRRGRRAQIVEEDSDESDDAGDDVMAHEARNDVAQADVAPRERPVRRAAAARRRNVQEMDDDEDGEDAVMADVALRTDATRTGVQTGVAATAADELGTLGYDWDIWDVAANANREGGRQDEAHPAEPPAEQPAELPAEPDRLWDGEEEDAGQTVGRASSRRGRGTAEAAPAGRRTNRRRGMMESAEEDESGLAAAGDLHRELHGEGEQVRHVSGAHRPSGNVPENPNAPIATETASDAEPVNPPRRQSQFSTRGWLAMSSINELNYEDCRQLLPTLPASESPALSQPTPQEPVFDTMSVPEAAARQPRELVSSQHSERAESVPAESGPPPLLSEPSEEIPLMVPTFPERVPVEEVVSITVPAGFNPLAAMLSNFEQPRAGGRRRRNAAANPGVEAPTLVPPRPQDLPSPDVSRRVVTAAGNPPQAAPTLVPSVGTPALDSPAPEVSRRASRASRASNPPTNNPALLPPRSRTIPQPEEVPAIDVAEGLTTAASSQSPSLSEPVAPRPDPQVPRRVVEREAVRLPVETVAGPSTEAPPDSGRLPRKKKVSYKQQLAALMA